jgi:hypothetical protein
MKQPTRILKKTLEILWLIVFLATLFIAIKETISKGFFNSYIFYIFSIVAFFFFLMRKKERQNREKHN